MSTRALRISIRPACKRRLYQIRGATDPQNHPPSNKTMEVDLYVIFRPRAIRQTAGTVFSYTDRPRPVNNLFIFFFCFSFSDDRRESVCEQSTRVASHCHSLVMSRAYKTSEKKARLTIHSGVISAKNKL